EGAFYEFIFSRILNDVTSRAIDEGSLVFSDVPLIIVKDSLVLAGLTFKAVNADRAQDGELFAFGFSFTVGCPFALTLNDSNYRAIGIRIGNCDLACFSNHSLKMFKLVGEKWVTH
ncbi:hypothetical protein ACTXT7_000883, partial [Hymenolepis weldensis]